MWRGTLRGRPEGHRVIAESAISGGKSYFLMGLLFGVRIFCYGQAGRALALELERPKAERVCWKYSKSDVMR